MSWSHHRARLQTGGPADRGAALVEFAFIALILITLAAGGHDYGQAWRVGLATNEAARTAARTGSGLGTEPLADWYALSGARAALANSGVLADVERVIIYRSSTSSGTPPTQCLTATSSSAQPCNILTGEAFRALQQSNFSTTTGCHTTATIWNWCASTRRTVQVNADYYGVWIRTRSDHEFSLIGSSTAVKRRAVMRLEPEVG